jgi:curved DNA-binding protein CbpA
MAQAEETHYVVLGLLSGASRSEGESPLDVNPLTAVRQAFRNLALECHPDKVDPKDREAATQRFQRVSGE